MKYRRLSKSKKCESECMVAKAAHWYRDLVAICTVLRGCIKLCHQFGLENGRGVALHQPVYSICIYSESVHQYFNPKQQNMRVVYPFYTV